LTPGILGPSSPTKLEKNLIILLTPDFLNNFFAHPYKIIASKGGLTHHLKA
jgi:hypothetical protein